MATGYYLLDHRTAIPQCGKTRRGGAKASGTIILHDAEGGTDLVGTDTGAENVANFIRNRTTYGSYHRLVDRDTRIKMAPIDYETWHSVPDNPWSVGICVAWTKAHLPNMTPAQRRSYYVPLAREVLDVRAEFARRGIKVPIDRFLTAAETQARKPGISTHSRTDPGRRSDPFGTGSKYETEFLAVLAELSGTTTPAKSQEDDVTLTQTEKAQLGRIDSATATRVGDVGTEAGLTQPQAIERLLIVTRRTEARVELLAAANAALAKSIGIDPKVVTETVDKAVTAALADLQITLSTEG